VALLAAAAAVAITTSVLWRRSDLARHEAEVEVHQRQAAEQLALGRLRLEDHPMAALAHAIASLEHADSEPARRFAVEALWRGPTAHFLPDTVQPTTLAWSADGRWLALGGLRGAVVFDRDTGNRLPLATGVEGAVGFSRAARASSPSRRRAK
jgi:hypothetical protein